MAIYQYGMVHSPKYLPTYAYSQFSVESLEPGMYGLNIQQRRMGPWEMHGKIEAWTMRALLGLLLEQLCGSVQHQLLRPRLGQLPSLKRGLPITTPTDAMLQCFFSEPMGGPSRHSLNASISIYCMTN